MAVRREHDPVWMTGWAGRRGRRAGETAHPGLIIALVPAGIFLALLGELNTPAPASGLGVVEGRVVDTQGHPVTGVEVRLQDADPTGGDDSMGSGRTDARGHYRIQYSARAWDCCRGMRESDPDIYAEVWRRNPNSGGRWELLRRSEVFPDHHPASHATIHFAVGE